ncbi:MAG: Hint domain-containing protein [Candidatus Dormibacteraeota bacterium]|nr:Hint domain-containing protein [Candidatus Dormibacteraeota bacterium]
MFNSDTMCSNQPIARCARRSILASLAVLFALACGSASPGPIGKPLNVYELKFRVMDTVGTPVFCDPDFYPVARLEGETANAVAQYPQIRAQADLYAAIIAHEHLSAGDLTDAQKLIAYRAFKLLRALTLTQNGNDFAFASRAKSASQSSVQLVKGTVRVDGVVTVTSTTPSAPPPCPICLAATTLIATPNGEVRVIDIKAGMLVWTASPDGKRVPAPVLEVGSIPVPAGHLMVHLQLADGRELLASPRHLTPDGRPLGALAVGDRLDGSTVTKWELVAYSGDRTYDVLPAGETGTYWADGILLASTLARA